jgi:hypothetical protein
MQVKIMILLLVFFCYSVQAQSVQYNEEFRVNLTDDANLPSVTGLAEGGFVACWQSNDGSGKGIFGQMFDSSGSKVGDEFQINTYTSDYQDSPVVSDLTGGGFVVCWRSYGQDGDRDGIFGQIYEKSGSKSGDEFQVNTYTSSSQSNPSVSGLSDGGFVVCWQSLGQDGDGAGIFGQFYNENGSKTGQELQVNTTTSGFQGFPCVSGSSDGGFVVSWQGEDQDFDGIFAQRYDRNGVKQKEEFQVNLYSTSFQSFPSVCSLSDSGFVICWESAGPGSDALEIFGQIYNSNGTKRGDDFQVNTYISSSQLNPGVSELSDGDFVVCWQSPGQDGDDWGIFGQLFNRYGIKQGKEFQVNTYTSRMQNYPSLSYLKDGNFVVIWQSFGQDQGRYNIYGKYYLGVPVLHTLNSFSLISPIFDEILYSTTITFDWQKTSQIHLNFPWELEYVLYLDLNEEFSDPQIYSNINDTTFTIEDLTSDQTYFWKVLAKNIEHDSLWSSDTFGFYISPNATDIEDDLTLKPDTFKLFANYPNPFNPRTIINYELPITNFVDLSIYNTLGQRVATLVKKNQRAGYHQIEWDASGFASGVYFLILESGIFKTSQKMLLLK